MAEPDRLVTPEDYLERWSGAHGGYDPRGSVWARGWLGLTHRAALPLARRGIAPHAVTAAGLAVAALVPVAAWAGAPWAGAALVVLAGLLDSVDGAVALLTGRATRSGYVLDSVADRLGEALLATALWVLGAPGWLCVLAAATAWLHEYVRARAVGAGLTGIGVVTVGERPARLAVAATGLLAAAVLPSAAAVTAAVWAVLGTVGLAQLALRGGRSAPR
ncbi:MAG TPA: CDP-alcohol phosphatidyltransferase family protein [Mycobacteriales bacterium]